MPGSANEGKVATAEWVLERNYNIRNILDVGCGWGTYRQLFRDFAVMVDKMDAIEVWTPYIEQYSLDKKYTNVYNIDARQNTNWNYDLVIFGDVLEHMTKEDAVKMWEQVSKQAKYAIISIPIIHYPQGHLEDNPYQEHIKEDWTVEEVLETFPGITEHNAYGVVGVFYATFDN